MTVFNKLFNPVRFFPISHMVALSLIIMLLALSFWVDSEKRYVKLNVSAAFHSKYMLTAQNELIKEIDKISFNKSHIPIISNFVDILELVSMKYCMSKLLH